MLHAPWATPCSWWLGAAQSVVLTLEPLAALLSVIVCLIICFEGIESLKTCHGHSFVVKSGNIRNSGHPFSDELVRCSAIGRSFVRLRYQILKSVQHTMQYPATYYCIHPLIWYFINVTRWVKSGTSRKYWIRVWGNSIRTGCFPATCINSDCYANMCYRGSHCIIMNYEVSLCYYDDISSNSQAGQRKTGMCYYGQLGTCFSKNTISPASTPVFLSKCIHNVTPRFYNRCLFQLSLVTFKLLF